MSTGLNGNGSKHIVRSTVVIDDNEADIEWISMVLEDTHCFPQILPLTSAEEALKMFEQLEESRQRFPGRFPPTLIFLDLGMPGFDGFEFLNAFDEWLTKHESDVRQAIHVYILSASKRPSDRIRALTYKCVRDYFVKPLTQDRAIEVALTCGQAA